MIMLTEKWLNSSFYFSLFEPNPGDNRPLFTIAYQPVENYASATAIATEDEVVNHFHIWIELLKKY